MTARIKFSCRRCGELLLIIVNLGDVEKEKKFVSDYLVPVCPNCLKQAVKEGNRNSTYKQNVGTFTS